jgi:hypothetical protein
MRLRPVLLSVLAVGLVAGGSALAAPKPACNLVTDNSGDGQHRATGLKSSALDIRGVEVATGTKEVVGVITMETTNTANDPYATLFEFSWGMSFSIQGQDYSWTLSRPPGAFGGTDTVRAEMADAGADVKYELKDKTITFTTPRKYFANTLVTKPGKLYLENISAVSYMGDGNADSALGGAAKILDLYPHCSVKPA